MFKPEGIRRIGKPELKRLGSVEEDLKWVSETGDVISRTENSGGQFWKRLSFTKDSNARGPKRRRCTR